MEDLLKIQTSIINKTSFDDVIFTVIDQKQNNRLSFKMLFSESNIQLDLNTHTLCMLIMKKIKIKGKSISNIENDRKIMDRKIIDRKIVTECLITFDSNKILFISEYLEYRTIIKNISIIDKIAECMYTFDNNVNKNYRISFKKWIWDHECYKYITFKDYGFHDKFLIEKYGFKILNFTETNINKIKVFAKSINVKKIIQTLPKGSLLFCHLINLHMYNNDILSFIMSNNNITHNIILSALKIENNEQVNDLYKIMQEFPNDLIFERIM